MTIAEGVLGAIAGYADAAQALEKMKTDSAARIAAAKLSMAGADTMSKTQGGKFAGTVGNSATTDGWSAKPANPDSGSGWSAAPNAPGSAANPIRYQPGMPELPSGTYVIHPDGTLAVVP
jgi:hypothetical protein